MTNGLSGKAATLRALHVPGRPLVLPNVWDVTSALAVVRAGYPAVATSSEAVAGSLGHRDGQDAPAAEMFAAAARIAGSVDVPVTVDAEAGYGLSPVDLVDALLTAGAVGCNLEDTDHTDRTDHTHRGLRDVQEQADHLAAVRAAADVAGVPIVINARIDTFLTSGPPGSLLSAALDRAMHYRRAGADCVYPILLHDPALLTEFCAAMAPFPVNALGSYAPAPGRIGVLAAADAGVARLSFGPDLWRAATRALSTLIPPIPDDEGPDDESDGSPGGSGVRDSGHGRRMDE